MNKGRLIKTVAAVSALVMLTSVTAFAKPGAFEMGNGKIYLDGETQARLKELVQELFLGMENRLLLC